VIEGQLAELRRRIGWQADAAARQRTGQEPEPEPEEVREPEPVRVAPVPPQPDLAELARLVRAIEDRDRRDEARYTLFELRRYADAAGALPPELVRAVLGDLFEDGRRVA